jgi:hypothetical protein
MEQAKNGLAGALRRIVSVSRPQETDTPRSAIAGTALLSLACGHTARTAMNPANDATIIGALWPCPVCDKVRPIRA